MSQSSSDNQSQTIVKSELEKFDPNTKIADSKYELDEDFKAPSELLSAQSLANKLDSAVRIPIVGIKVGLDSIIGLIPGIGDTLMLLASLRILYLGKKLNMPKGLQYKMARNALFDYLLGFVPIIGDIVDIFFKANLRNVRIMEKWWVSENKDKIDALAKKQLDEWHQAQDSKSES